MRGCDGKSIEINTVWLWIYIGSPVGRDDGCHTYLLYAGVGGATAGTPSGVLLGPRTSKQTEAREEHS